MTQAIQRSRHEIDHVHQQTVGPVAGSDNGTGVKVSHQDDPYERASAENGRQTARGGTPELAVAGAHGHDGAVQRAAQASAVQRMENPPRGRRGGKEGDYEADVSSSGSDYEDNDFSSGSDYERQGDSSPERETFAPHVGPGRSAQYYMEGLSNPYRQRRFVFEPSSSSDEERNPRQHPAPAPAPAPAPRSQLADRVRDIVYRHVVENTEGSLEDIRTWADYAADAASVMARIVAAEYADGSVEATDFLSRYPLVYGEVFAEHSQLLFVEQDARMLTGIVMNRIREEQLQNQAADQRRLPRMPESQALRPLRALLMRELLDNSDKKLKVTLVVDAGSLQQGDVGHAWIEITGSNGEQVSFGFYPAGEELELLGDVKGGVECPDLHEDFTHRESKKVKLDQIVNGYRIAHEKAEAAYNLTQYNCTTFAGQVWKAMTGQGVPQNLLTLNGLIGMFVPTPGAAGAGLDRRQVPRLVRRRERLRVTAQGPLRAMFPGAGDADEVADRMARAGLSQSSESESSEEVD
ncbi:hypothetical protein [Streptomyces kebangsaanensis]|uniref:hypothetical protein n=1 Tax=Streptomyces kebangsaanensis TaxID=864058 RepID=UPI000939EDDC|nr:hypothetical protein [Streptomyces kebangsaanensis]